MEFKKRVLQNHVVRLIFIYTIIFIFVSALVFSVFAIKNKSFIWEIDGIKSYYTIYYNLKNTISEKGIFNIPIWTWNVGLGMEYLGLIMLDFLSIPFLLLPINNVEIIFTIMILSKIYFAGIACIFYLKEIKVSTLSIIVSTIIYIFSGYVIFFGITHPFFINPLIIFPILLIGIERVLQKRKTSILVLAVFLAAINSYYFFYMMVIGTIIYCLFRFCDYIDIGIKEYSRRIINIVLNSLMGVILSLPIVLAQIQIYLNSNRAGIKNVPKLYQKEYYKDLLPNFIGAYSIDSTTIFMFSAIVLLMIPMLFRKYNNNNKSLRYILITMTLIILLPIGGSILNGFSTSSNRWSFIYSFMLTIITAKCLDKRMFFKIKDYIIMGVTLIIYTVSVKIIKYNNADLDVSYIWIIVFYISTLLVLLLEKTIKTKYKRLVQCGLVLVVCLNIAYVDTTYYIRGYANEFYNKGLAEEKVNSVNKDAYDYIKETDKDFYRINIENYIEGNSNTTALVSNDGLIYNLNIIGMYVSPMNNNIWNFYKELNVNTRHLSSISGHDNRAAIDSILGVKYEILDKDDTEFVPYGFEKVFEGSNSVVYKNKYFLPIGFVYTNYVTKDEYLKYNSIDRQNILLDNVVVEDTKILEEYNIKEGNIILNSKILNYNIVKSNNIEFSNNSIKINKDKAKLVLGVDIPENNEIYLEINDIKKAKNDGRNYTKISSNGNYKKILIRDDNDMYNPNYNNRVLNMGYVKQNNNKEFTFEFSNKNKFSFSSFNFISVPMDQYEEKVTELNSQKLENIKFDNDYIEGDVTLDKNGLLFLSIPYDKKWEITVNGEKSEFIKANTGFIGVPLKEGDNKIKVTYKDHLVTLGIPISISLLIIYAFYVTISNRKFIKKEIK